MFHTQRSHRLVSVIGAATLSVLALAGATAAVGDDTGSADRIDTGDAEHSNVEAAAAGDGVAPARRDATVRFLSHERKRRVVDLEPVGEDSAGDHFWSYGRVYDVKHSRRIGSYVFRCEATPFSFSCDNTTHLRGRGKLYFRQTHIGPDATGIVLGGTDEFVGARGQMTVFQRRNGHEFDADFRIELVR